jgi:hypothetical protein
MQVDDFDALVHEIRVAHPAWLELPPDAAPTPEVLAEVANLLPGRLPAEYLDFVTRYGGGDVAFAHVYSLDPASDLYLPAMNAVPWLSRADFIAFSDNGGGDHNGFVVKEATATSEVWLLDHESGDLGVTEHEDIYAFLAAVGMRQ